MLELIKPTKFPFMTYRKRAYMFSIAVLLVGLAFVFIRGGFRLGVDFAGGRLIEYRFDRDVSTESLRAVLQQLGVAGGEIQKVDDTGRDYLVRLPLAESEQAANEQGPSTQILESLQAQNPGLTGEIRREELVGPRVGKELRWQATVAVTLALLGILGYVAIRYEWRLAVGGVIALSHDVLVTLLMCAIFDVEITISIIAALMTIGGYSINDTVVVFDRVREVAKLHPGDSMETVMNRAINETLSRTILTGLATIMCLFSLYFFGGQVIHDFAWAMLIGVIFGIYSSVYVAAGVALEFHNQGHKKKALASAA